MLIEYDTNVRIRMTSLFTSNSNGSFGDIVSDQNNGPLSLDNLSLPGDFHNSKLPVVILRERVCTR